MKCHTGIVCKQDSLQCIINVVAYIYISYLLKIHDSRRLADESMNAE